MFSLYADKTQLNLKEREPMTSGSVNVYPVRFQFSADWDGLSKTAIFRAGEESRAVLLDESAETTVPWEVLVRPDVKLYCGIYGTQDETVVLPTIWASLGWIFPGASPGEDAQPPPTPELWKQELEAKGDALSYDGFNLSLMSGAKPLSTVQIAGGGGHGGTAIVPDIQMTASPLPAGSDPTVTRSGSNTNPLFDLGIPEGQPGKPGDPGKNGNDGVTFTPSVSEAGMISWTNDRGLPNPEPVDIKGPPGPAGSGADLTFGDGITQDGDTVSVTTPVRGIYTQDEYDALPEEQKSKGLLIVDDGQSGGGSTGGMSVPSGVIWPWYHTAEQAVPAGWVLCDGTNGTPDLRGRFILGASDDHAIGETGGSEEVTLTTRQLPQHYHTYEVYNSNTAGSGIPQGSSSSGTKSTKYTSAAGNNEPHPNMPPYFALDYIMKL